MNTSNQEGRSIQNNTYLAIECRSFFSKGKFEQELMGKQFVEFNKTNLRTTTTVRPKETAKNSTVRKPSFEEGFPLQAPKFDPYELNDAVTQSRLTQPNRLNFRSRTRAGTN
jgi:hypothetical protein